MKRYLFTYTLLIAVAAAATWVAAAPALPRDLCCSKQFGDADGTRSGEGRAQRHVGTRTEIDRRPQAEVGVGACDSDLDSRTS